MKAQFSIKQVNIVKNSVKAIAKSESANVMKFLAASKCCDGIMIEFNGQPKPVFSL